MRLGRVIGRVTLSQGLAQTTGARWLLVSPLDRGQLARGAWRADGNDGSLSREPSLVVYDNLGAGVGDTIGFVEGREAAQPLDPPPAIDAINAALIDHVHYRPLD